MNQRLNPIEATLNRETHTVSGTEPETGSIAKIISHYDIDSDRLLGFLLDMTYDEIQIVTCDAWKQRCGGVPRNSFIVVKLSPRIVSGNNHFKNLLILCRITEAIPTPVKQEIQQTIFQIHKVQAVVDPLTDIELQWGALKATILGTYYDSRNIEGDNDAAFGNDVDSFYSPHFYEAYVPTNTDLNFLVNLFVSDKDPVTIGQLRYTETLAQQDLPNVPVQVSADDFIGNRTALFGKTRMGKSNTIKVIADIIIESGKNVGQVIFDPSGEYSYYNEWDKTSIYLLHTDKCTRYSLKPRTPDQEFVLKLPVPKMLRANFFKQVSLGHHFITSLFDTRHDRRPDYMSPFFNWDAVDPDQVKEYFSDMGERTRYLRTLSMYYSLLYEAGYKTSQIQYIQLHVNENLRKELAKDETLKEFVALENKKGVEEIRENQRLSAAASIYKKIYELHESKESDVKLFPPSKDSGMPYFDPLNRMLLRMLGDNNISGPKKLTPFVDFHDPTGSNVLKDIVADVDKGKTVIIDLSNADEAVSRQYSEMICREILSNQMKKFADNKLGTHSVLFYFEEAHTLFRQDDRDLTNIYNKLAKEGAKFKVGMVYATQSMTTLSPDLLKNTENFFIAHLNDDREIKELSHKYEFRDVALDVQRSRTKGYVRMITLSQRFALPVQIRKFEPKTKTFA